MQRLKILLVLVVAACSAKAPAPGPSESRQPMPEIQPPPVGEHGAAVPPPDPREFALSQAVLKLVEQEHLLHKRIDDDVSRAAFATYIDRLDGQKMFLLKSDVDALKKHETTIDDELRSGSLDLAHEGLKIYVSRVAFVEKAVAEILAGTLDHADEEYIELDPKKVELAATEQDLRDRWRRRLELEVMERVAQMDARLDADKKAKDKKDKKDKKDTKDKDDTAKGKDDDDDDKSTLPVSQIPPTPEGREAKAKADLAKSYAARFTRLRHPGPFDAASDFVNAITASLDPHTTYLPPADKANFDIHMSGSLEGIGAVLREKDDYIEIVEIVPGGAAWRQGTLQQGDLILSVASNGGDPVDVVDMRIDDVVKMIRGPKGTKVTLHVQKPTGNQQTVTVTRDVVVVEETYARGAVLTRKGSALSYGYIHLPSFYGGKGPGQRTAAGDVERLLGELKAKKVAGIVIDIRSNGGGLLGDAIEMTGELIDRGPVVQVQDSRGHREVLSDDHPGTDYDGPVVVLVDRFSASASEILAGALQDYKRAVIVGTGPTHGKGTVQTLADLDRLTGGKIELGVLKITIQQFFRVSGSSTQREGVTPDVVLPDPAGHLETGERELEHAIPWSQVPPAKHDDWPAKWKSNILVQKSAARVSKDPVFAKIATLTQVLKARKNDTRVPLQKSAWETRRKEQKAAIDAASPDSKAGPARFTVKSFDEPTVPAPGPGGKPDDRLARWRDNLAKDAWVDESLNVLGDMTK